MANEVLANWLEKQMVINNLPMMAMREKLANEMGVTVFRVNHWVEEDVLFPAEYVSLLQHVTKGDISRKAIRPDIFSDDLNNLEEVVSTLRKRLIHLEQEVSTLRKRLIVKEQNQDTNTPF